MTRYARALGATFIVVLLGSFVVLVPQKNASGAPPPTNVIVTNTPLPVSVTNTPLPVSGGVNVNNFPASQNVNGTVQVGSLPPVTLSGTSPVSVTNPVSISNIPGINSPFNPLFVEPDAAGAEIPDAGVCGFTTPLTNVQDAQNSCTFPGTPPAQDRRVLENFSVSVSVPAGTVVENAYFGVTAGGTAPVLVFIYMPLTKMGTSNNNDYYVGAQVAHTHFTSNVTLACGITTVPGTGNVGAPIVANCAFNGKLVFAP